MDNRIDYNAVDTAVKVAENASFARAGKQLRLPVSTVSARVQALERSLGIKLFDRSTRRVRLTEAGQTFVEHASRGSKCFEDAVSATMNLVDRPRGLLRIVAPALFARHLLPRLLPGFLASYPDLSLSVDTFNVVPDLVECGADIGIGVGPSRWAAYTRRSLVSFFQGVYASPECVARWRLPSKPDQLASIPLLAVGSRPQATWVLRSGSRRQEISQNARVSISDVSAVYELALAGMGAALLPIQLCNEDVSKGTLIRLLPGWTTDPIHVSAYYQRRRLEPKKVTVFLDYVLGSLARTKQR